MLVTEWEFWLLLMFEKWMMLNVKMSMGKLR
jgi:hypothetical protein